MCRFHDVKGDAVTVPGRETAPYRTLLDAVGMSALFIGFFLVNLWIWKRPELEFVANDVGYYGYWLNELIANGDTSAMSEYPMPAVWILRAIYWVGGGWQTWLPWFAAFMVGLTAVVAMTLFRAGNTRATMFWIVFIGTCGPIVWFRFDLIPAALVTWACLWITAHPRIAGAMVALGAGVKLWPALLIFPLTAPNPLRPTQGRQRLLSFLVVGLVLGLASLVTVGWQRSVSPITWQGDRGLQMESVPATVLMFLRTFTSNPSWPVGLSEFNAIELSGPGVAFLLHVSTALTVGSFVLTVLLTWRLVRRFRADSRHLHEAMLLSVLAILLATIVANKTLSPQYIPWLGGPVAALLLARRSEWLRRHVTIQAVAMVMVAGLTQYTYPWGTHGIMSHPNGSGPETSVLVLRNVLLVAMLVHAVVLAWRASGAPPGGANALEGPETDADADEVDELSADARAT